MPYFAHGSLIRDLRKFIAQFEGSYNQSHLLDDIQLLNAHVGKNTLSRAEQADETLEGHLADTIDSMARALSFRLKTLRAKYPDHHLFHPLNSPKLGYILDRIMFEVDPILALEYLIMNHESRYLVDQYRISLTVWPKPGGVAEILHQSRPQVERFPYDNVATVKYSLKFSANNQRLDPSFRLSYVTHSGRVTLKRPGVEKLSDDRAYLIHRASVGYLPDPTEQADPGDSVASGMATHRLEVDVFNGFGPGDESAHFKLAQPALYRSVELVVDLTGYPDHAITETPTLIMVPVLKDRPFNCCDIARTNQGLRVDPDESYGLKAVWRFKDLSDVMLGVHWGVSGGFAE